MVPAAQMARVNMVDEKALNLYFKRPPFLSSVPVVSVAGKILYRMPLRRYRPRVFAMTSQVKRPRTPGHPTSLFRTSRSSDFGCRSEGAGQPEMSLQAKAMA